MTHRGKLCILWYDVDYDVLRGIDTSFLQSIVKFNSTGLWFVPPVEEHLVKEALDRFVEVSRVWKGVVVNVWMRERGLHSSRIRKICSSAKDRNSRLVNKSLSSSSL